MFSRFCRRPLTSVIENNSGLYRAVKLPTGPQLSRRKSHPMISLLPTAERGEAELNSATSRLLEHTKNISTVDIEHNPPNHPDPNFLH